MYGKDIDNFIRDNHLETSKVSFFSENCICITCYVDDNHNKEIDYQLWFDGLKDEEGNIIYETIRYIVWRSGKNEPIVDKCISREVSFKIRLYRVRKLQRIIKAAHEKCERDIERCKQSKEEVEKAFTIWKENLPTNKMLMKEVYEKDKFIYRALRHAYEKRYVFYKDDEWTGTFNTMSLKTIVDKIGGFKEVAILSEIGKTRLERIKQWYQEESK